MKLKNKFLKLSILAFFSVLMIAASSVGALSYTELHPTNSWVHGSQVTGNAQKRIDTNLQDIGVYAYAGTYAGGQGEIDFSSYSGGYTFSVLSGQTVSSIWSITLNGYQQTGDGGSFSFYVMVCTTSENPFVSNPNSVYCYSSASSYIVTQGTYTSTTYQISQDRYFSTGANVYLALEFYWTQPQGFLHNSHTDFYYNGGYVAINYAEYLVSY